ncbi:MAG: ribosomal-processing cysteine protease Prp [Firmicutes bacterium]|nr:ribosomal-processing cysteine protease Prp [Bacillota bacterium]
MIKVEVQRNPRGEIVALRVQGHSGYAARGEDIVCAGVSTLAQSAVLGMERFLPEAFGYRVEGGFLKIEVPEAIGSEDRRSASVILETAMLGIEQIARKYPKNIKIVRTNGL